MEHNPIGWRVLGIVVILCLIFWYRPWRTMFVYPRASREGKWFYAGVFFWIVALIGTILRSFDIRRATSVQPMRQDEGYTMIALDGSLSMSADDVLPSRFARARDIITEFVDLSPFRSYGLMVFSGLPVIRIPWTQDTNGYAQVVKGMALGDFPPTDEFLGTALGDAILLALYTFQQIPETTSRSLVIISDGDSNKGYDPYKLIAMLQEQNIKVYFIALGEQGYEVGKDATGLPVITSFDAELMQQFADDTQGELYWNPGDAMLSNIADVVGASDNSESIAYSVRMYRLNDLLAKFLLALYLLLAVLQLRKIYRRAG